MWPLWHWLMQCSRPTTPVGSRSGWHCCRAWLLPVPSVLKCRRASDFRVTCRTNEFELPLRPVKCWQGKGAQRQVLRAHRFGQRSTSFATVSVRSVGGKDAAQRTATQSADTREAQPLVVSGSCRHTRGATSFSDSIGPHPVTLRVKSTCWKCVALDMATRFASGVDRVSLTYSHKLSLVCPTLHFYG